MVRLLISALIFTAVSYLFQVGATCAAGISEGGLSALRAPSLFVDPFDWQDIRGIAPVLGILSLELTLVGWRQSSLRRLVYAPSASARTDWTFLILLASGLYNVLIVICGFGLFAFVAEWMTGWAGLGLFTKWSPWAALAILYVFRSFSSYWLHRLQHSRWFWPLHKVHHAADEFTSLNYLRGHPIELAWQTLANTIALAAIGVPADTVIMFEVLSNTQQFLNHSNAAVLAPLEKLGIVTPAGHRVHHGLEPRHHNRNFGELLNVWDRLFGTYLEPPRDVDRLAIGLPAGEIPGNPDGLLHALWAQSIAWARAVRNHWAASTRDIRQAIRILVPAAGRASAWRPRATGAIASMSAARLPPD
jgi:sterol desaturase/sphingolipid hydroxylase (fatty acid hydroxylase superfamily)